MYEKFCQKLWHLYIQAAGVKPTRNPVTYRHLSDDQASNSVLGHCSQYFARLRIWNSKEAYLELDGDHCVFDHVFSSLGQNGILSDLTHLNSRTWIFFTLIQRQISVLQSFVLIMILTNSEMFPNKELPWGYWNLSKIWKQRKYELQKRWNDR